MLQINLIFSKTRPNIIIWLFLTQNQNLGEIIVIQNQTKKNPERFKKIKFKKLSISMYAGKT